MAIDPPLERLREMAPGERWEAAERLYWSMRELKEAYGRYIPTGPTRGSRPRSARRSVAQPINLVQLFTDRFEAIGLRYMVTGSVAGVLYGEPRLTHDVDVVVELDAASTGALFAAFPLDDFYCPPLEIIVEEARRPSRGHFKLMHHQTGFRADVYVLSRDPLHRWGMDQRRKIAVGSGPVAVAPPEYVVVRKLEYFREGGSEKHVRDIAAILRVSRGELQESVVDRWVANLGLEGEWARAKALAS